MSVKTQALDRVLEALSPALAAEMDRLVQETREGLEEEFKSRLEAAIRDAETLAASAAQSRLEQAVEQAKDQVRAQTVSELEQQFAEKLETASTQLRSEGAEQCAKLEASIAQSKDEWAAERTQLQGEIERWRIFAEIQRQFAEASSQQEILSRFLMTAEFFADGLAVYVRKPDGLAMWKSKGTGAFPDIISEETTDPEWYFRPISVRGKTVGAICAAPSFKADSLEFLVASLERGLEIYGLKLRTPGAKAVAS
jgi:hypothetical protein